MFVLVLLIILNLSFNLLFSPAIVSDDDFDFAAIQSNIVLNVNKYLIYSNILDKVILNVSAIGNKMISLFTIDSYGPEFVIHKNLALSVKLRGPPSIFAL